ncbi:MAG: hypothetical protein JSR24_10665 [Proteobacteria bacterium]|nr:hypothetical protein [Pseudomonadota bacterium]
MEDLNKAKVLQMLVGQSPRGFWSEFGILLRQTYMDTFEQVAHERMILSEHKIDYLLQLRHFRVESLLHSVAQRHGLPSTATLLVANHRSYVMAGAGSIAFTQAYIPTISEMPQPARFREKHSLMNEIARGGRLALGDQPVELLAGKAFYGIICHNPVGRRFEKDLQKLGMVQFCVPGAGCKDWLAEVTFQEIVAAYGAEKRAEQRKARGLPWKDEQKKQDKRG